MATAADAAASISMQVMIVAVVFLFMAVIFVLFLYLFARYFMGSSAVLRRSRARFVFVAADQIQAAQRGLDAEVLKSLPVSMFNPSEFKGGLECAVCLSELSEGEEVRLLPKCNHGFHVECIDMWFHSHSTCPVCRTSVTGEFSFETRPQESVSAGGYSTELPNFPTNVLFWGNQDEVSNGVPQEESSRSSMLVIDIPRRSSRFSEDEMKSPMEEGAKTPKSARLRSLRRLLSRGKMVIGSSCSPREVDIEQGEGSSLTPKTPNGRS
ncbi:uncharacterized protein A4U43_C06F3150 [Asparagus officinalis]|uniref:RING-type E3 ubiquitin transferase n=1 Tax=Asparagus officinalis TaxID=4686 RepID=A0A5P1EPN5_ASPOF|nr:RING-H2 finger protein ATL3-like [Asparagus officinalis]ONK66000.1 uncharacterized protein A4U43_C06F3150 [Asparagus officinalis]